MKKAVLYIRSTRTNQPARQRPRIQQYLAEHRIEVVAEEVERAGSKSFPAFKRALDQADGRLIIISNLGQMVKSPTFMRMLVLNRPPMSRFAKRQAVVATHKSSTFGA